MKGESHMITHTNITALGLTSVEAIDMNVAADMTGSPKSQQF